MGFVCLLFICKRTGLCQEVRAVIEVYLCKKAEKWVNYYDDYNVVEYKSGRNKSFTVFYSCFLKITNIYQRQKGLSQTPGLSLLGIIGLGHLITI